MTGRETLLPFVRRKAQHLFFYSERALRWHLPRRGVKYAWGYFWAHRRYWL